MRTSLFVVAAILGVGLLVAVDRPDTGMRMAPQTEATESISPVAAIGLRQTASAIAAHPDRGQLLAYDRERRVLRSGASTWHPVHISEAYALRAIAESGMTVRAPNGEIIRLRYERHFEHPDGNWTWIGREDGSAPGTETVLTFGEKAVFGTIRQGNADLSLTTEAGSTWLVETDYSRSDSGRIAANEEDLLIPTGMPNPMAASAPEPVPMRASGPVEQIASLSIEPATAWTPTTVDVVMGFTTGFATRLGGESQARTRLHFLVDTANEAYLASGINAQIRLVRSLQVDYPDATHNRTALFELTGVDCTEQTSGAHYMSSSRWDCTPITQPVGLQPLTAARATYGGDLLVLVRKFEAPEQVSCGSAWMLGGGQSTIDANSAAYGMTVVSDSSGDLFPDNGSTCPDVHLAHELGHNMGQQHDLVTAIGSDDSDNNGNLLDPEEFGRHAYSFGYSTDGTLSDIATIMSNRRPNQTRYRVFGSPLISTCGGAPCGTADQEDNARSMGEVMPVVAAFRTTQVVFWDANGDHWAYDFIRRIFNAGITAGCGTNPPLYCPDAPVTRDQMAVFLLRGIHGGSYVPPTVTNSSFSDVPSNHWAISWIERLFAEGITAGCGTNPLRYCPSNSVSRDQMAIFLLRAKHGSSYTPPPATGVFDDVPVNYWAAPWIEQLAAENITAGCSVTPKLYCPTSTVTRDQMAVFLARTFNL